MKKTVLAIILSVAVFSAAVLPFHAIAAAAEECGEVVYDSDCGTVTYVNRNGEENKYETETLLDGTTIVRFFVDGELQYSSEYREEENGSILVTRAIDGMSVQENISISESVTLKENLAAVSPASIESGAFFRGNIFFYPRIVNGVSYERVLGVSYEYVNGDRGIYTINGYAGDLVSDIAASIVGAVASFINVPVAFYISYLSDKFSEFIINDVIVGAFTEDVMAYNGMYNIYSENVATGTVMDHYGYTHRVIDDGLGDYEDLYTEGYLPFGDDYVARQMFIAHWGSEGTEWTGINYYVESPDYAADF